MGIAGAVVGLTIASIIIATTLPLGLQYLMDTGNWSGVTGAPLVLGKTVIPIVIVAAVVLLVLSKVRSSD